jgi:putative membrane protein
MNSKALPALCLCTVFLFAGASLKAQSSQDTSFLAAASQSDFNEIQLSRLAAKRSSNPDVKAFANKMVNDHSMLEQNMSGFAEKWGVEPAVSLDDQHQAEFDKLGTLSGADFDKEYIQAMDADHHTALGLFQQELQTGASDPSFRRGVQGGEEAVAQHTQMVDKLATQMGLTPGTTPAPTTLPTTPAYTPSMVPPAPPASSNAPQ